MKLRLQSFVPCLLLCITGVSLAEPKPPEIMPAVRCSQPEAKDQDDLCFWEHPSKPAASRVIVSDKEANRLFVYGLDGKLQQSIPVKHPGNIDSRRGFLLAGKPIDIVAVAGRAAHRVYIFQVDEAGQLTRIDDGKIATADNYGGALFRSSQTGQFYFISTGLSGKVEQFVLSDNGQGKIAGKRVRDWKCRGICEGAFGDDEAGKLYIADENHGVWMLGGEPNEPAPGGLIIPLGKHGLKGDVEGLTMHRTDAKRGYLIVSNQGSDNFKVYRRESPGEYVGTFTIRGVKGTDGLDLCQSPLGSAFPGGVFGCHSDEAHPRPIVLSSWQEILKQLPGK